MEDLLLALLELFVEVVSLVRGRGKSTVQLETFWYAFAVAFGMALVRFLFAT